MSWVVRKSSPVVVRASMPVLTTSNIKLSFFDKGVLDLPTSFFFVFEHPIHKAAETIQSALSQALVHYYPVAGRLDLGANDDGKPYIRCTGEGAVFVAAAADCALKETGFIDRSLDTATLLDELAPHYPAKTCSPADPLLLMQVTEFSCGGFVIGSTWNHVIFDARGMGQFMQAIGELARGFPAPTVAPVRYDHSLPGIPPVAAAEARHDDAPAESLIFLDITIPSSFINHIKAKFSNHTCSKPCSVFDVVAAVLWQCRTCATMTDPEAITMLFFTVNARKLMGAKHGYYGNCVSDHIVTATSGSIANGDLIDIIKMIKHAKEQIPSNLMKDRPKIDNMIWYNNLGLSCMRNLGLDEIDVGCGKTARVMVRVPQLFIPVCAACLPWKGKDGASVLSRCVKEEIAKAFLAELARITT